MILWSGLLTALALCAIIVMGWLRSKGQVVYFSALVTAIASIASMAVMDVHGVGPSMAVFCVCSTFNALGLWFVSNDPTYKWRWRR